MYIYMYIYIIRYCIFSDPLKYSTYYIKDIPHSLSLSLSLSL